MRQISGTLSAAQKAASNTPYVKLEAKAKIAGVDRLEWDRLYTGSEDDYFHAVTMPGDGSLVRARITPPGDIIWRSKAGSLWLFCRLGMSPRSISLLVR